MWRRGDCILLRRYDADSAGGGSREGAEVNLGDGKGGGCGWIAGCIFFWSVHDATIPMPFLALYLGGWSARPGFGVWLDGVSAAVSGAFGRIACLGLAWSWRWVGWVDGWDRGGDGVGER